MLKNNLDMTSINERVEIIKNQKIPDLKGRQKKNLADHKLFEGIKKPVKKKKKNKKVFKNKFKLKKL